MDEMTALQALEELYGYSSDEWNEGTPRRKSLDKAHEVLRKALTPPTSEEVCKALSEHDEIDVKHERGENLDVFYYGIIKHDMNHKEYIQKRIICIGDNSEINLNASLPPHLIELIGRFYGGLK